MAGPVDNLVKAFAVHLEACAAKGDQPSTLTQYEGRYRQYLTFLHDQGHEPPFGLELLNPQNARSCAVWVQQHSRGSRGGASAVKALLATLKTGSAWLADEGYLPDYVDPLARVKRPKAPSAARTPLSQDDVRALVGAATETQTGTRDTAIMLLMLDTGMRVGGVCSILRNDIDLKERRVKLRLKGGSDHTLYFGSNDRRDGGRSARAIARYVTERDELVTKWSARPRGDKSRGHLFLSYDGWPLTERGFHEALASLARAADITGVFPHRFRHAQPLYAPVLTPDGWKAIGDLSVGDSVIGADGHPTPVIGVYPQGEQEIVRITFSDGANAECTLDHLWTVRPSLSRCWPRDTDHWRVMSTRDLIATPGPWHTPAVKPIDVASNVELPVEPYTLGALLGDGHFGTHGIILACHPDETEVIERVKQRLPTGVAVGGRPGSYMLVASQHTSDRSRSMRCIPYVRTGHRRSDLDNAQLVERYEQGETTLQLANAFGTTSRTVWLRLRRAGAQIREAGQPTNSLMVSLRKLDLLGHTVMEKHIPRVYFHASLESRVELLRGLMDTDGYVNKTGAAVFTTISPDLASGVVELVRSLGGIATATCRKPYHTAKHDAYRIGIRTPMNPFHMSRKAQRYDQANAAVRTAKPGRTARYELVRTIRTIEPVGVAPCLCIEVANADGLYVTQDYVVTHNTFATWYLVRNPGDETGLRGILGHLSADMYRTYAHLAHEIIAQRAGRVALSEAWLGEEPVTNQPRPSLAGHRRIDNATIRVRRTGPKVRSFIGRKPPILSGGVSPGGSEATARPRQPVKLDGARSASVTPRRGSRLPQ